MKRTSELTAERESAFALREAFLRGLEYVSLQARYGVDSSQARAYKEAHPSVEEDGALFRRLFRQATRSHNL